MGAGSLASWLNAFARTRKLSASRLWSPGSATSWLASAAMARKLESSGLYPPHVDPALFTSGEWGEVRRTPGDHGYFAFFPSRMKHELVLDAGTVALQSKADIALGRLAGAGRLLPNAAMLVAPYALQESLDSSRIEGTQATLSDVFSAKAGGGPTEVDVREVFNYQRAMTHGLHSPLPLSKRLMREMHEILLTDVRGEDKTPGEFRKSQNWIGGATLDDARFVPPPVDEMERALDDWEVYQHEETLPLLIRCGLLHYQFETIHPFLDGNGRLGRLFITLFLVEKGPLSAPLLYVSSFFEANKQEYYDRLQAVREHGDIAGWLKYFLRGVAQQAEDAVSRAEKLMDIRERYRQTVQARYKGKGRVIEVVDLVLENPILSGNLVADRLGVSRVSGLNILRQLEAVGIVRQIENAPDGSYRWFCDEVMSAVYGE